eukprot:99345-Alexandrium_andersonii.AAC.1
MSGGRAGPLCTRAARPLAPFRAYRCGRPGGGWGGARSPAFGAVRPRRSPVPDVGGGPGDP